MKKCYLYLVLVLIFYNTNAQVGINTANPDSSSILEMLADDKGLLIPRVSLLSLADDVTIPDPANSLLAFNKVASNDIGVGYYYWSAPLGRWVKLLDELDKPGVLFTTFDPNKGVVNTASSTGVQEFNFTEINFNSIVGASFTGDELTLPPGDYVVESQISIKRDNFDYILRINGIETGVKGTMATVKTQAEIVAKGAIAVFTLTVPSTIDFVPKSNNGGQFIPVDPILSYMKITKL